MSAVLLTWRIVNNAGRSRVRRSSPSLLRTAFASQRRTVGDVSVDADNAVGVRLSDGAEVPMRPSEAKRNIEMLGRHVQDGPSAASLRRGKGKELVSDERVVFELLEPESMRKTILATCELVKHGSLLSTTLMSLLDDLKDPSLQGVLVELSTAMMPAEFETLLDVTQQCKLKRVNVAITKAVGDLFYLPEGITGNRQLNPEYAVRYMLSLVEQDHVTRALELWHHRKSSTDDYTGDMCEVYWWWQIGVKIYARISDVDNAIEVGRQLLKRFGRVSTEVRKTIFLKLCEVDRTDLAKMVYTEMFDRFSERLQDVEPEEVMARWRKMHAAMKSCARAALNSGDDKLSNQILKDMESLGQPDYSCAVMQLDRLTKKIIESVVADRMQDKQKRVRAPRATVERLEQVLVQYRKNMPLGRDMTAYYDVVFRRLHNLKMVGEMAFVFRSMLRSGVRPSSSHTQLLLKSMLEQNYLEHALRVLSIMEEVRERQLGGEPDADHHVSPPEAKHYALFVQYYVRRQQHEQAAAIINRLRERDIQLTAVVHNALLSEAFHRFDHGRMWDIFGMMKDTSTLRDGHTYAILWRAFSRFQRAKLAAHQGTMVKRMEARRLLEKAGRDDIPAGALRLLLKDMAFNPVWKPSAEVYRTAIATLLVCEDVAGALCALEMCAKKHRFQVFAGIETVVIQNLARLAFRFEFQGASDVASESNRATNAIRFRFDRLRSLEISITQDLKSIVEERMFPPDVEWEDLMKLVYYRMEKVLPETSNIVFNGQLQEFREELNLAGKSAE